MNREFQVVVRETEGPNSIVPVGAPLTVSVIAPGADEARAMFDGKGFVVLGVTQVRAVVDWDKPFWDLDEYAAAIGIKGGTLSAKKGNGKIPWSTEYNCVPRRVAVAAIEKSLNEPGREILRELEEANEESRNA